MKSLLFSLIILLSDVTINAQTTAIPDANFEQALINLGLDLAPLNGTVLTANIDTLTSLNVNAQSISNLTGIEDFIALISLHCSDNQLTSLDITNSTSLKELFCWINQLTSIDVTQNTALVSLGIEQNQLTNLDVTQNTALVYLDCNSNPFTSLDVTQNIVLEILDCNDNQLTYLNVRNGNNNNFIYFNTIDNPNLTCIEVDNVAYSNANWTNIDPATSFGTDCFVGIDEENNNVVTNVYPNPASNAVNIEVAEKDLSLKLIDVTGKVIEQVRLSKNINSIDVSTVPNGFYTLLVYNTQGVVTSKKLIVAH